MPHDGLRRPGRLRGVPYVGIQRYFLTLCTAEPRQWFTDPSVIEQVRSQLSQSATEYCFTIPAYCVMPDHAHVLADGTTLQSDLQRFVSCFKQKTGFRFSKERGAQARRHEPPAGLAPCATNPESRIPNPVPQ